jgi:hypothetical protein
MHLLPSVAMQPNSELKTRPKKLLGSLPLVIALPGVYSKPSCYRMEQHIFVNYDIDCTDKRKTLFSAQMCNKIYLPFRWRPLQHIKV